MDTYTEHAKDLVFAAMIVQLILTAVSLIIISAIALFLSSISGSGNLSGVGAAPTFFSLIWIAAALWVGVLGMMWVFLDYFLIYRKLSEDKASEALTVTLVLGIIQLLTDIIPGILLLIAYSKIEDSVRMNNLKKNST